MCGNCLFLIFGTPSIGCMFLVVQCRMRSRIGCLVMIIFRVYSRFLFVLLVVPIGFCWNHVRLLGNDNLTGVGISVRYVSCLGSHDLV